MHGHWIGEGIDVLCDPDAVCAAVRIKKVTVDYMLCRIAVDWYGLPSAINSRQHHDDKGCMLSVLSMFVTTQNAYFMPNEAYQPKSSHFHQNSFEKMLSWTDRFRQLDLTASNGFNKREMILHSDLYAAKLSKMGRLAFCQMQKNIFYLINLVISSVQFIFVCRPSTEYFIRNTGTGSDGRSCHLSHCPHVYMGIFKLILKACKGVAWCHDQLETVLEICNDETISWSLNPKAP